MQGNVDYNYVEIRAVELNLAHISNKHKLVFTFFNKTFKSKKYNLALQLNNCRKSEEIVLSTHGIQSYEYYMNKNCISNTKSVLSFFAELISKDDDTDRSNTFSISKLVNFSRKDTISINPGENYKTELPFNWLFYWSNGKIIETTIGKYSIQMENILKTSNRIVITDIAKLSILKNKKLAAVEWDITNESLKSPFLQSSKFEIQKRPGSLNKEWILFNALYTERNWLSDEISISTLSSIKGLYLPFYSEISPLVFEFTLKANFLYSLNYNIYLPLKNMKPLMAGDCTNNAHFCLQINRIIEQENPYNHKVLKITFKKKDIMNFVYNGMKYKWFESWTKDM